MLAHAGLNLAADKSVSSAPRDHRVAPRSAGAKSEPGSFKRHQVHTVAHQPGFRVQAAPQTQCGCHNFYHLGAD